MAHAIGWVFRKRVQFSDHPGSCIQEVWVTLYDRRPDVQTTEFPHHLD